MSVTIKYKELLEKPVLITPAKRSPSVKRETLSDKKPEYESPLSLYLASRRSNLKEEVFQQEQERVLSQVRSRVANLAQNIDDLTVPQTDLLPYYKYAKSSEPQALSAEADQEAPWPSSYSVKVYHPARGQVIQSQGQNPIEEVNLADGEHTFILNLDGEEKEVSVTVNNTEDNTDTQEEFLERLGILIESQSSQLTARLEYSFEDAWDPAPRTRPMNRVVRLVVESSEAGMGPDFHFTDTEGESLISDYGLDRGLPPQAAMVYSGGAIREQSTNQLSLADGHLNAEIKDATNGMVEIEVLKGGEELNRDLQKIIDEYNSLVDYLDLNSDLLRPSLKDRVIRPLEDQSRQLFEMGLQASPQGKMKVLSEFPGQLTDNYSQVKAKVLDDDGWMGRLKTKLDQILDLEEDAFAAQPATRSNLQARQEAWALLEHLTDGIINGYY
ncbi:hypothetical protein [Dethiosulfatarculus sandiegensis]|uniref:Flagellar hook-associated protein 2 C-terminal domain-containing protein n=1 Tax=Dethiosulfatarculus sandiegensis TaxID=1429043 RepID=A0A0D2J7A2_9BACT|nr:hypothetical protein [Dethiosulfatarculus sandiegensis]KIX11566.1 hypothetical protein X474_24460 [Dethiosulfatarculus sandiegensis]